MLTQIYVQQFLSILIGCTTIVPNDRNFVMCWSLDNLKNFPFSPEIIEVSIFETAKKQTLKKGDLDNVSNLKYLHLNTAINGIEEGALFNLKDLVHLSCDDCHLPILKASYFNNSNLRILIFENSNVYDVEEGVFSKSPNLHLVWLVGNHISVIKKGVFANTDIRNIVLKSNRIKVIEDGAFFNMDHLEKIELDNNLLKSFDSTKLIGKSSKMLHSVHLADNKLSEITKSTIRSLPLKYLNVTKNAIYTIEVGSFHDHLHLQTLDLSHNRIAELKPDIINEHNNLTNLMVHGNDLSYISTDFLNKMPKLNELWIAGNPWQCACLQQLLGYMKSREITDKCYRVALAFDESRCLNERDNICKQRVHSANDSRTGQYKRIKSLAEHCHTDWWTYARNYFSTPTFF